VPAFVEQCRKLEAKYGERFKPAQLLLEMAAKGKSFYGCFGPGGQEKAA
jgi:3-hydroxyacyl-CoA dehydrogenase/enoyl-CoA hydratase/3-hydroxybutyryl-CoA epimerase